MNANNKQSENRGTKRAGASGASVVSVDDALVAATHVNEEIDWKSVGTFGCYHCPHAFSKKKLVYLYFAQITMSSTRRRLARRGVGKKKMIVAPLLRGEEIGKEGRLELGRLTCATI